jgi:hypothetical protein
MFFEVECSASVLSWHFLREQRDARVVCFAMNLTRPLAIVHIVAEELSRLARATVLRHL